MKKVFLILIVIMMIMVVTACNGGDASEGVVSETGSVAEDSAVSEPDADGADEDEPDYISEENNEFGASTHSEEIENYDIGFTLEFAGFTIHMNQNMDEVKAGIGEPLGVLVVPSCAFDGDDRIYSYPGFQIYTYPVGDKDLVHTINISDDSIVLTGGIFLGSRWDDVKAVFGTDYERDINMHTFTRGNTTLAFLVEDDIITTIVFGLIVLNV